MRSNHGLADALMFMLIPIAPLRAGADPPALGGCAMLPVNNIWNRRIDTLPVDANSSAYINTIGANTGLHPDFGTVYQGAPIGIPYVIVPADQPLVPVSFLYCDESDPGPYPIPPNPPIEGGNGSNGDRHVLIVRQGECKLYELYRAFPQTGGSWHADSGAIFDLNSNALRPDTWTSADAAGLPILPGLVRYEEVSAGEIRHAIRFTASLTRKAHVWPARHDASSSTSLARPPMGQRFRLKASFNVAPFAPEVRVILTAFKRYGIILADNGSNWFISGVPNPLWNDSILVGQFGQVHGADFEAVDETALMVNPNSAQAAAQPGDLDGDGDLDLADYAALAACLGGPAAPLGASCGAFDFAADLDVDLRDAAAFQNAFTGSL